LYFELIADKIQKKPRDPAAGRVSAYLSNLEFRGKTVLIEIRTVWPDAGASGTDVQDFHEQLSTTTAQPTPELNARYRFDENDSEF
jgi:hypothetical protein